MRSPKTRPSHVTYSELAFRMQCISCRVSRLCWRVLLQSGSAERPDVKQSSRAVRDDLENFESTGLESGKPYGNRLATSVGCRDREAVWQPAREAVWQPAILSERTFCKVYSVLVVIDLAARRLLRAKGHKGKRHHGNLLKRVSCCYGDGIGSNDKSSAGWAALALP